MSKNAFVRKSIVPEQTPPLSSIGIIGWLKSNLFSSWFNAILTFLSTAFLFYVLSGLLQWTFLSIWNASSLNECREIAMATWGKTHGHACWAVINDRWVQLLFGFYPSHLYWRPILALLLLVPALAPVLFTEAPRKLLYVTATYTFLLPWLMWGGSLWVSISILLGFVLSCRASQYRRRGRYMRLREARAALLQEANNERETHQSYDNENSRMIPTTIATPILSNHTNVDSDTLLAR